MSAYDELKKKYKKIKIKCEVCDSEQMDPFQKRARNAEPGVYGEVLIAICRECGYKMINPRYEDEFYIDYYNLMYREVAFGDLRPSQEYIEQQKQRGKGVLDYIDNLGIQPGKMLDHGCASGCTMLAWQDRGWETAGIDPHGPSVEAGVEMGLNIQTAAGEDLPFEDDSFDLILSLGSTEHSYDLKKTMEEIRRVLKDGGVFVIRWRTNEIFGSPLEYFNHNHNRFFTPRSWALALKRYGFEIIAETDEKLEGWSSYSYIVARLDLRLPVGLAVVKQLLENGQGDSPQDEFEKIKQIRDSYYKRCSAFLNIYEKFSSDPERVIEEVKKQELDWRFLGGAPSSIVERSKMEAERYVEQYEAGLVV